MRAGERERERDRERETETETERVTFHTRRFIEGLIKDWDFENLCTAHNGNCVGGAKQKLERTLKKAEKTLDRLSERNRLNRRATGRPRPSGRILFFCTGVRA